MFPVLAMVADIFGNGNNLDEMHAFRQLSPHHPQHTPRNQHNVYPSVPDSPSKQNNKRVKLFVLFQRDLFVTFKKSLRINVE